MNQYLLVLKSDTGRHRIRTAATSEQAAREIVCKAELCPESAILKTLDLQFYNTDGTLTVYSFLCGYVERKESATKWKEIYMEHRTYHVRSGPKNGKFEIWENFERNELTKARKRFNGIKI